MQQDQPIDPDRWVDDHGNALFRYAMLRLRDSDAASEVVQETFVEALRARSKFEGRSSERTWLIGILKHKVVDEIRRRSRRDALSIPPEFDPGEFFDRKGAWKSGSAGWGELPDRTLERAEFWEVFRSCLADLPEIYAEVFTLSELEGMAGPEICQLLDITPTNLWARLHRARLVLRKSIEARWFGRDPGQP